MLDPSIAPPYPDPRAPNIRVKFAGIAFHKMGEVTALGVSEGILDPVTGLIPLEQGGVAYPDIYSVAVWRKLGIVGLVATLLLALPLTVLFVAVSFFTPAMLILAVPFAALLAYGFWRALGLKVNMVRVVGTYRAVTIRFDGPFWRRRRFHDELLRRAGISPSPIP